MKIYLNGKFVNKESAKVSVFDHGFLYGDGAFEGIRVYNGLVFRLKEHIDRLYETMRAIALDPRMTKKEMTDAVTATLKVNKLKDGYVRLIVSRGDGDLGLDPRKCTAGPNVVIIAGRITLYPDELYQKGMAIITVKTVKNSSSALDPRLKTLNYLNNILAKIEANAAGYAEAIMLDGDGHVGECTGDNIFIIKNGRLATPARGCLLGITRQAILDIAAKAKIKAAQRPITLREVYKADECFLTGTAAEIIPVVKVDGHKIGNGRPGLLTGRLLGAFRELTKKDGVKYAV